MLYPYSNIKEMYNEIDHVLSKYGLQIGTLTGQFKHPIEITITIEEAENEDSN